MSVASLLAWASCLLTGLGCAIWRAHHRAVRSLLVAAARSFSAPTNRRVSTKEKQVRTDRTAAEKKQTHTCGCSASYLCTLWKKLSAADIGTSWQSPLCISLGWCKQPYDAFSELCGCWHGGKYQDLLPFPEDLPPAAHQNQLFCPSFSPSQTVLHVTLCMFLQQSFFWNYASSMHVLFYNFTSYWRISLDEFYNSKMQISL